MKRPVLRCTVLWTSVTSSLLYVYPIHGIHISLSAIFVKWLIYSLTWCKKEHSNENYTGCPRRNVPDFGRVFLMLNYTDITQNTYIQSWTVTEIMAREKWGLLAVPNTGTCTADTSRDNASGLERGMQCSLCLRDALRSQPCYVTAGLSHV